MTLVDAAHIDGSENTFLPDALNGAQVAVNTPCPAPLGQSDITMTAVSVNAPGSANPGTPFTITAQATVHNAGPFGPVNVDTSFSLSLPPGCSSTPGNQNAENISAPVSVPAMIPSPAIAWSVTCNTVATHTFFVNAQSLLDDSTAVDPDVTNNSAQGTGSTAISALADVKTSSVAIDAPSTETVGTAFKVSPTATLHNNGPFGPVLARAAFTLSVPADCFILPPPDTKTHTGLSLAVSSSVIASEDTIRGLPVYWLVTCSNPGIHSISVNVSSQFDQTGLTDTAPAK